MQKDIFSRDEESQIRKAFDSGDAHLGLNNLDSVRALESVFDRVEKRLGNKVKKKLSWNFKFFSPGISSLTGPALASPAYRIFSVTVVIGLAIVVTLQSFQISALKRPMDPLRGGIEIFQIVDRPIDEARSLTDLLVSQRVSISVVVESSDQVKVTIPVNEKTIQLMLERRIELPKGELCTIVFENNK
jgi:hypothetical protein